MSEETKTLFTAAQSAHTGWTLLSAGLFVLCLIAFAVVYYNFTKKDKAREINKKARRKASNGFAKKKTLEYVIGIIAVGAFIRIVLAVPCKGYANDLALFKFWAGEAADDLFNVYNVDNVIDYPPGYLLILYPLGLIGKIGNISGTDFYSLIIKLPAIVSDCFIAWFIYLFARNKNCDIKWTSFFVALWMFNPLSILDTAVWGQVDSVLTVALVAGLYLLIHEKYILSGLVFGASIMLKPQAIIVLPVLFFFVFRNHKKPVKTFILTGIVCVATAVIIAFPFGLTADLSAEHIAEKMTPYLEMLGAGEAGTRQNILKPFVWILTLFLGTAGHYSYATVNGLNFWFLIGKNWTPDNQAIADGGTITYYQLGMSFIVLSAFLIWFIAHKAKKSDYLPFLSSAGIVLMVSTFGPRMHERYFYPAVAFMIIAALLANNKTVLFLASALSTVGYFAVAEVLIDLNIISDDFMAPMWPWSGSEESQVSYMGPIISFFVVAVTLLTVGYALAEALGKNNNSKNKIWRE